MQLSGGITESPKPQPSRAQRGGGLANTRRVWHDIDEPAVEETQSGSKRVTRRMPNRCHQVYRQPGLDGLQSNWLDTCEVTGLGPRYYRGFDQPPPHPRIHLIINSLNVKAPGRRSVTADRAEKRGDGAKRQTALLPLAKKSIQGSLR